MSKPNSNMPCTAERDELWADLLSKRKRKNRMAVVTIAITTLLCLLVLAVLILQVSADGMSWLSWSFLESFPSRFPERAGIKSALFGTFWMIGLTAAIAIPIGVGAAVYLEEFARDSYLRRWVDINIKNLAGVPSIVYGMLGLVVFVRYFGFGRSVIAGSLTMSLLILPVVIVAAREALKAVPNSIRHAAIALGATRLQTVKAHILPEALPGILTGIILSVSRALGETAPLIMIGALTYVAFVPENPFDGFTVLPIQIFNWASRPQQQFHELAAAGIIVLLVALLSANALAVFIRHRFQVKQRG